MEFSGNRINFDLIDGKYGDVVSHILLGSDAALAASYTYFPFIAPAPIEIVKVKVIYSAASVSGTLQLQRLKGTTAPDSGDAIFTTTISTAATANTVYERTAAARQLTDARVLKENERLCIVDGGTLTLLSNLVISIYYYPLGRGGYI